MRERKRFENVGSSRGSRVTTSLSITRTLHENRSRKSSAICPTRIASSWGWISVPGNNGLDATARGPRDLRAMFEAGARTPEGERYILRLYLTGMTARSNRRLANVVRPDVGIIDIGLPVMDGYEVAKRIREEPHGPHMLLALTGYNAASDTGRLRGFDYHLVKPVDADHLTRLITNAVTGA